MTQQIRDVHATIQALEANGAWFLASQLRVILNQLIESLAAVPIRCRPERSEVRPRAAA